MSRSYYSENAEKFFQEDPNSILGKLLQNDPYSTLQTQKNAWRVQIDILQKELNRIPIDRILFEYTIPRMGRRVDNVVFYKGVVYLLEFKVGEDNYKNTDLKQAEGYALDLKYFQEGSRNCKLVPILICTEAGNYQNKIEMEGDVCRPLRTNTLNLLHVILQASKEFNEPDIDSVSWENSLYNPTPTIIEAGQALYANHKVDEITRHDSVGRTFTQTSQAIDKIITESKRDSKKSIIFLTGIPGSGKTLVGLDVASRYQNVDDKEHSVYVCGTSALIHVIQEALVRDRYSKLKGTDDEETKENIKKNVEVLFQIILHYRKSVITEDAPPHERIVVFDEAQRMWDQHEADKNIRLLGLPPRGKSEPDLLIEHMDKLDDWAVILCLLGGGQEINKGEDGLIEWLKSIKNNFPHWNVFGAPEISTKEYLGDIPADEALDLVNKTFIDELHLKTSTRSFKAENFSKMINHLLDRETKQVKEIVKEFNEKEDKEKYHLLITRDLQTAKDWVKKKVRGNERCGIFTTALSHRLWPEGIVKRGQREFNELGWWLDDEEHIDSSLALEIPCTEFFSQGLELDWSIFGWDACLRPNDTDWDYQRFERSKWKKITNETKRKYLKNAFRVLLTRARQGMIIFVPKGDENDKSRLPKLYDGIYNDLKNMGISEI
tara:strand:+ start:183 stop:2168 length:1986 start_codon:yes stop_codon:yes gene_type:complete